MHLEDKLKVLARIVGQSLVGKRVRVESDFRYVTGVVGRAWDETVVVIPDEFVGGDEDVRHKAERHLSIYDVKDVGS